LARPSHEHLRPALAGLENDTSRYAQVACHFREGDHSPAGRPFIEEFELAKEFVRKYLEENARPALAVPGCERQHTLEDDAEIGPVRIFGHDGLAAPNGVQARLRCEFMLYVDAYTAKGRRALDDPRR